MNTVLVIREADVFSRILAENGFEVINLPMIEIAPLEDLSEFEAKLAEIENYDGIFLTSINAAQIFVEKLREKNVRFNGKVYVLGKRSFDVLKTENLNVVHDESANTAREMLERIPVEALKNKRFLFIRGVSSLRIIPEFLKDIAALDETIVYETRQTLVGIDKMKATGEKMAKNEIAAICLFSPSAGESFLGQFGREVCHQTYIAAIGKTTAEFFERQGYKVDFVSSKATAEDFAIELVGRLGKLTTDGKQCKT